MIWRSSEVRKAERGAVSATSRPVIASVGPVGAGPGEAGGPSGGFRPSAMTSLRAPGLAGADQVLLVFTCGCDRFRGGSDHLIDTGPGGIDLDVLIVGEQCLSRMRCLWVSRSVPVCSVWRGNWSGHLGNWSGSLIVWHSWD